MWVRLVHFAQDTSGATAVEYGLIAALISVGGVTALSSAGTGLQSIFGSISGYMSNATSP
jgi:pilus assembly protein Flp/PilA